jgi:hypothetical protein
LLTLADVIIRQCKDQLPGGKFWNQSQKLIQEAQATRANNISGERVFAHVDQYTHRSPNTTVGGIESHVMSKVNKTVDGWKNQDEHTQEIRFSLAKKDSHKIMLNDRSKDKDVTEKVIEK